MLAISISGHFLNKALDFFDRVIGSQEKRRLILGGEDGIYLLGTDGVLTAQLLIKKGLLLPYSYILPLNTLKAFIKGRRGEEIRLEIKEKIILRTGLERLEIPFQGTHLKVPPMTSKGIEINLATFCRLLDISSVISDEDTEILFFCQGKSLGIIGQREGMFVCTFMPLLKPPKKSQYFSLPYVPTRHLVKALKQIKEKKAFISLQHPQLEICLPKLKISANLSPKPHVNLDLLRDILQASPLAQIEIELSTFKNSLSRLSRMEKHLGAISKIKLARDKCVFNIISSEGVYVYCLPLGENTNLERSLKCGFRFLNSVFQRLKGKRIKMSVLPQGCLFRYHNLILFLYQKG